MKKNDDDNVQNTCFFITLLSACERHVDCGLENAYTNVKITYANGDIYRGEFRNGKLHGVGKYTWKSGHTYVGDWREGNRNGRVAKKHMQMAMSTKANSRTAEDTATERTRGRVVAAMWANFETVLATEWAKRRVPMATSSMRESRQTIQRAVVEKKSTRMATPMKASSRMAQKTERESSPLGMATSMWVILWTTKGTGVARNRTPMAMCTRAMRLGGRFETWTRQSKVLDQRRCVRGPIRERRYKRKWHIHGQRQHLVLAVD